MGTRARILKLLASAAVICEVVAACSSDGAAAPSASPTVSSVDEAANGKTLRVAAGSSVRVTLHSTYWHFDAVAAADILRRSSVVTSADTTAPHIPGSGAGTVVAVFAAVSAGSVTVSATRTSCGEALRCVGGQGSYRLTVVVS